MTRCPGVQNITSDFPALLATMQARPPIDFRLNPSADLYPLLKQRLQAMSSSLQTYTTGCQDILEEIPWYPAAGSGWRVFPADTFLRSGSSEAGELPGPSRAQAEQELLRFLVEQQNRGALARQELVSMLPVTVLGRVSENERVLDMCASPGSKASQLLGLCPPFAGLFVANEFDRRRLGRLHHRLQKECASHCTVITNFDARFFPALRGLTFHKIICDVPCSGDGILRRAPQGWASYDAASGLELHGVQAGILERALDLLLPGGRLVYSTCSQNPLENEAVIARVLAARRARGLDDIQVQEIEPVPGLAAEPGLTKWLVPEVESECEQPVREASAQSQEWTYQSDHGDGCSWDADAGGGNEEAEGHDAPCSVAAVSMQQVMQHAGTPRLYGAHEEVPVERRAQVHGGLFPPDSNDIRTAEDLAKVELGERGGKGWGGERNFAKVDPLPRQP